MRGFGQSTSLSLVGWLWADILLGLFALFLAANTAARADAAQKTRASPAPAREGAIARAYGVHADASTGDQLAKVATVGLTTGAFAGSTVRPFHELAPLGTGDPLTLDVYLFY